MADMKIFEQYYQASFGHSLKSTRDVWFEFVKDCEESALKQAMDTLEEVFMTKRNGGFRAEAPTLGEVKREYWQTKNRDGSGTRKKYCSDSCAECDGSGSVLIVIHKGTKKVLDPQNPQPYAYGELAFTNADCPHGFFSKRRDYRGFGPSHLMPLRLAEMFMVKCDELKKAVLQG